PFGPKMLILRPEIDIGNNLRLLLGDAHVAACGLKIEGPAGPSMHPEVCRRSEAPSDMKESFFAKLDQ
ncbi:MAG: hypothetical protein IKH30_01410, partial [Clostridia bacterium]|nr:hypothetical protein [Clostridia bacterium]